MKRIALFLVGAALIAGQARAAGVAAPLTFDECVREAALNNPDLYAAREGVHVARANLLGGYSPFLPQVSASAGASKNNQELRAIRF